MKELFADTGYWIALFNERDELHEKAQQVSREHYPFRIVTSEWVLTELLDHFAARGASLRAAGVELIARLRDDANTDVVPVTSALFREATDLYGNRLDKEWSLTDCSSILIAKSRAISGILAHDGHFVQAGLVSLLRD